MIPGSTTKLTEGVAAVGATIKATTDIILVNGTGTINTINPNFGGGYSGILILLAASGTVTLSTAGNIAVTSTIAAGNAKILIYSRTIKKWHVAATI
jgi:hypothetical protein